MVSSNRRKSWNNDLFVKFMVTICAGMILQSYNKITDSIDENKLFIGEMREFKAHVNVSMEKRDKTITQINARGEVMYHKQMDRTENVRYSGLLRRGDKAVITVLCSRIKSSSKCQ